MSHMNRTIKKPLAVDLFSGCGGISCGLKLAGFQIIAGVDVEPKYINSFAHNFPEAKALTTDLSITSGKEFMNSLGLIEGELDLLAGGPPCQGFSKNVPRKNRILESSNNQLIKTFLDYAEALQPKMVLMENVAEMKNGFDQTYTEEVIFRLEKAGYTVTSVVLNAADYGVPQRRRRAFFLANRLGVKFDLPPVTHYPIKKESDAQIQLLTPISHISVWDAIGDLPSVANGEKAEKVKYASEPLNDFQKWARTDSTFVINHSARNLKDLQFQRLASLQPGQGLKDLPKKLQVKGGYSGAYGRLTKEMIAPTITRWVFHPGSGRWGHPVDVRTLTIREAARIQGFPDVFQFIGSFTQQAGQLGNAVPPLLAYRVISHMLNQLSLKPLKVAPSTFANSDVVQVAAA